MEIFDNDGPPLPRYERPGPEVLDHLRAVIKDIGHVIVTLVPDGPDKGQSGTLRFPHGHITHGWEGDFVVAHTIGNSAHGVPELLVTASAPDPSGMMTALLNGLSRQMIQRGAAFDLSERVFWGEDEGQPWMRALPAPEAKARLTGVADRINGPDYDVLQIVTPDREGAFPWEDDCDPRFQVPIIAAAALKTITAAPPQPRWIDTA